MHVQAICYSCTYREYGENWSLEHVSCISSLIYSLAVTTSLILPSLRLRRKRHQYSQLIPTLRLNLIGHIATGHISVIPQFGYPLWTRCWRARHISACTREYENGLVNFSSAERGMPFCISLSSLLFRKHRRSCFNGIEVRTFISYKTKDCIQMYSTHFWNFVEVLNWAILMFLTRVWARDVGYGIALLRQAAVRLQLLARVPNSADRRPSWALGRTKSQTIQSEVTPTRVLSKSCGRLVAKWLFVRLGDQYVVNRND